MESPEAVPAMVSSDIGDALSSIRQHANAFLSKHQLESATFWYGQAMYLSKNNTRDVIKLAECLILRKQFHRASTLLKQQGLDQGGSLEGLYLAAKAAFQSGDLKEALLIIENCSEMCSKAKEDLDCLYEETTRKKQQPTKFTRSQNQGGATAVSTPKPSEPFNTHSEDKASDDRKVLSSIYLLKGQILEALDNRCLAAEAYQEAVRVDVYCHEAFKSLVKHNILSVEEEMDLLDAAPIDKQTHSETERELVTFLHKMSVKKYATPQDMIIPAELDVKENIDLQVAKAERHFYNCDYVQCNRITTSVIREHTFHEDCLPIHISCLVELQKSNDLFHLGHKLVDLYPEWVVAWFAVGCYYFMVSKHEFARRYLSKATLLDPVFGPAWLAYGHSFAMENEHDQAMAAYFKAFQLMKGCHLPLLYVGVEYGLTNNPKLAEQFFGQALEIAPKDPFVLHEMGVTCYQNEEYVQAESYFKKALAQVKQVQGSVLSSKWESLVNNLGHTCRKLGKFQESLEYHQQALVLQPMTHSTYAAIGYAHALLGDLIEAVEAFHRALSLKRDDTFSKSMLNYVIEQLMGDTAPFEDYHDCVPRIEPLDPDAIHVPTLQHPPGSAEVDEARNVSVGHKIIMTSPMTSSSPLNVTNSYSGGEESQVVDMTTNQSNLSNSLDVDMADVTMEES